MRTLLKADRDEEKDEQPEINLSAASLLGLFLGLVLVCGVFFGFGYSVGRRDTAASTPVPNSANAVKPPTVPFSSVPFSGAPQGAESNNSSSGSGDVSSPAPIDASSQSAQSAPVDLPIDETPPPERKPSPVPPVQKQPAQLSTPANPESTATVRTPVSMPVSVPVSAPASAAQPSIGEAMVQVAAVAHRDDADVLVSALRQRGYSAVVRNEPQDKLLHIQVGPYPNRAQALAMRQKLLSDGYNAIIKQ